MLRQLDEGRMQVVEHDRLLLAPWPSSRRRRRRPSQQMPGPGDRLTRFATFIILASDDISMRHFDANLHHAIVFEEFDVGQYNVAMLKRLCEGRNYSYPVSRTRDRTMTFRGPIIFVSPDDTYIRSAAGEPFLRRLFAVHAAVPYWHADRIIVPDSCYDDDDVVEAQASTSSSSDATMVLLSSASAPPAAVEHDDNDDINIISESSSSDSSRTKSIEFGY
ncbi:hypothetical protein QE152_g25568 [Popillia japonica]|uniref:Uncharacterized protein n=1 Tax=Popillia japonica TaxID=7064 RepID=A0AAW1K0J8_POPJA